RGRIQLPRHLTNRQDDALGGNTLRATLDRLLNQWLDRKAARGGRIRELGHQRGHGRGYPVVELLRDRLLHDEEQGKNHSVNTLLRRPKPSSTEGAPGSGTHRSPSTTNA